MESILARALEYTLKYWLKSFTRDQFKLQGRTVQLSNLDINGDALHSSVGLPPALNVSTAKVGKLEIVLPSVSNVQIEPIVVQIDRLDLVLEENTDPDACASPSSSQPASSSARGSGYGFADKIADGMTLEVGTVNLMLETRGGAGRQGGATWTPPMAAITIRNLILQTTNENWQVVNLKEARDFSSNKKFIYVFKKLEWQSLSIDLLPHPDMFMDERLSEEGANRRDDDGARRVFFGGERFLEGISGQAYITIQRTQLNDPLGLEVQLHISEAVCPALSEPGLRALLRFLTGVYVCLNRGDVDPKSQRSTEAAGRSVVSIIVDHIFLCTKDSDFRLELLMQSLVFSRASISDGEQSRILTKIMIDGFFLRDTFFPPPCTLIQPSMQSTAEDCQQIPDFAKNFCPPIYPLGEQASSNSGLPFICIHSLQVKPTPAPPLFASETVIDCRPLMVHLQEESCLRISSFLADGIAVSAGSVLPDFSVNSLAFTLRELDLIVPLDTGKSDSLVSKSNTNLESSFSGARLHVENLFFYESPTLSLSLLDLEKDPACLCLWEDQPVDAGQKKWTSGASNLTLSLETRNDLAGLKNSPKLSSGLWRCVELKDACIEVAMTTPDGSPLVHIPPPEGVVRVGIACEQYLSNTSVEQLFFVLDLYAYFAEVSEKIAMAGKNKGLKIQRNESSGDMLLAKVPSDSAVCLAVGNLQLRFIEDSVCSTTQGNPLVQFIGNNLFTKVSHRTLGGAMAISSTIRWEAIEVDCVDAERPVHDHGTMPTSTLKTSNGYPELKAVLWVHHKTNKQIKGSMPFLDASVVHVVPFDARDAECHSLNVSACIAGVHLGGGVNYAEALLHQFGILGPDGGAGEGLTRGLQNLSAGPLSKIFKGSHPMVDRQKENGTSGGGQDNFFSHLGKPDDVDISVVFKDWLFALEGAEDVPDKWFQNCASVSREERCWHTSFDNLRIAAKNSPKRLVNGKSHGLRKYLVDLITIGVEGLQTVKPRIHTEIMQNGYPSNGFKVGTAEASGGVNLEARMIVSDSEDRSNDGIDKWVVENLRFSVEQPIEAVVTKDELQHLAFLCKTEVDSMGRIVAAILRVLKLEGSIGQSAIDQLSNLGSEGFGSIFAAKAKILGSSDSLPHFPSTNKIKGKQHPSMESVVASLEGEIEDSQSKCMALITDIGDTEHSAQHLDAIKKLGQKLESMRSLLMQLRTQS